MSGRHLAYPFRIGTDGRTATPRSLDEHVKQELIQLLLTNPGEREFLPDFGGGVRRLIFENNSDVAAGVAKATINQAVSHWLTERLELTALEVENDGSVLRVGVQYKVRTSGEEKVLRFEHEL